MYTTSVTWQVFCDMQDSWIYMFTSHDVQDLSGRPRDRIAGSIMSSLSDTIHEIVTTARLDPHSSNRNDR